MKARILAVTFSAGLIALPTAGTAMAKIDAQDVKNADVVTEDFPLASEQSWAGGYAFCPAGTTAFTGGAFTYPTGQLLPEPAAERFTRVSGSSPAGGLNAWYGDAYRFNGPSMTLRVVVKCLPDEKLEGAVLRFDTAAVGGGEEESARAKCPRRMRVFTGGSFWHQPSTEPTPSDGASGRTSSSTPMARGNGWYADGEGGGFDPPNLTAYAWCLPERELAGYRRAEVDRKLGFDKLTARTEACPRSHPAAAAAGMFFHRNGRGLDERNARRMVLFGVGALEKPRLFLAAGHSGEATDARLTARAFCLRK